MELERRRRARQGVRAEMCARWALYSRPLEFSGPVTLRAKAIRYGYGESDETWQQLA